MLSKNADRQQPEIAPRDGRERDDIVEAHRGVGEHDDGRGGQKIARAERRFGDDDGVLGLFRALTLSAMTTSVQAPMSLTSGTPRRALANRTMTSRSAIAPIAPSSDRAARVHERAAGGRRAR